MPSATRPRAAAPLSTAKTAKRSIGWAAGIMNSVDPAATANQAAAAKRTPAPMSAAPPRVRESTSRPSSRAKSMRLVMTPCPAMPRCSSADDTEGSAVALFPPNLSRLAASANPRAMIHLFFGAAPMPTAAPAPLSHATGRTTTVPLRSLRHRLRRGSIGAGDFDDLIIQPENEYCRRPLSDEIPLDLPTHDVQRERGDDLRPRSP